VVDFSLEYFKTLKALQRRESDLAVSIKEADRRMQANMQILH
jgi:hypothetical protein